MRFTKTQAWQHIANKTRDGESDLDDKFHIIDILRREFNLFGLTGEVLRIDDESCRLPDIMVKGAIPIVIELDGPVHGMGDQISKRDKDIERDKDYASLGVKLIIINKELTNNYDINSVTKVLLDNGLIKK